MKKNVKLIIALLVIITIGVGAIVYINLDNSNDPPIIIPSSGDVSGDVSLASKVIIRDVTILNKTDNRYIDCIYPAVTSLKSKEFENYINNEISKNIQAYRNEIEFIVDEETPDTALYSYITSYERHNCGKYLSLIIDQNYQTGGIRSGKWKDIYNINVETERFVYLADLFKPGVNYEEAILNEIIRQSAIKNYELMGGNGIKKLAEKEEFYIKDDKLVLYFKPAKIAANVYGELYFEMPFVMNEDGYFEI